MREGWMGGERKKKREMLDFWEFVCISLTKKQSL